ncbi:MAG: preprotein translocase subunit YajC [Rhodothermaceae bacterium]
MEFLLFAMGGQPQGGEQSMMSTLIMFGAIFLIFYFMIIRPQQKRQKDREKMINEMKKGDKVITSGGLHGTVAGMDEKTLLVDLGNNIKVTVERSSVTNVVEK